MAIDIRRDNPDAVPQGCIADQALHFDELLAILCTVLHHLLQHCSWLDTFDLCNDVLGSGYIHQSDAPSE